MRENTIKQAFSIEGKGLHTGLNIHFTCKPAPAGSGIQICRTDLDGCPTYPAAADYVSATSRGTVLERGAWRVSTIEHCMAALYGMQIDNCLIEVDGPEFPILDGSAQPYVDAILQAGVEEQDKERDVFVVNRPIEYVNPESGSRILILPDKQLSVDVHVGYDSDVLRNQYACIQDISEFASEVARARTFVFVREIAPLLQAGLIKGGDLNNALVIYDKEVSQAELDQISDLVNQPHIKAERFGYINTTLHFDNEPARHKLLDLLGDLALVGKRIQGHIIAWHPGHTTNTALAKQIRRQLKHLDVMEPHYDPAEKPIYDIHDIRRLLPHRYPFALVDKIIYVSETVIIGVKNLTINEPFFQGHFPDEPVMPGVLQIEAMAQTGGILVLHDKPDAELYSTYFLKINNVKFRQKVVPGDTAIFRLELIEPVRRGISTMRGYCFVGGVIASEAEFTAQIIKNKG
ncbi:MAG: bifunctional UDP-3-O-[Paludibacteraceae bacterium]|nr:bifunctional UDP-3-O-[3-hydroxymyristoyl] N-acetylglucosamine deacetylase/3-hydroxyacyl-ACP dehydratase [Paludibacteraceae bacterium]